jgi:hypothetical protein
VQQGNDRLYFGRRQGVKKLVEVGDVFVDGVHYISVTICHICEGNPPQMAMTLAHRW